MTVEGSVKLNLVSICLTHCEVEILRDVVEESMKACSLEDKFCRQLIKKLDKVI